MAVNDFTGKNIQDTYKRVVQTDGTNLADGTGSLLPISFDGNTIIASGNISSSGDIYGKNLYGANAIYHDNDVNTGILFSSDSMLLKGNNQQIAKFQTNQVSIGHKTSGPTNITGSTVGILGESLDVSGNISSSGTITALSLNIGTIDGGEFGN